MDESKHFCIGSQHLNQHPRTLVGSKNCRNPYNASLLNISAMSYSSLSKAAITALNGRASFGEFAHNTWEECISRYHNEYNGALLYQDVTAYFGSRGKDGKFSEEAFSKVAAG